MTMFLILIIAAYLLGSIPFGLIIASHQGTDLRTVGSGNIGATNVSRTLGRKWGYICFVLDSLKGLIPMLIAGLMINTPPTVTDLTLWLITGCAAIIGHIFPIYLRFKGGKGVSTCLGVVLGLCPYYTIPGLTAFAIWAVCVLIWRYVSLASIIASLSFPVSLLTAIIIRENWQFENLWPLIIVALLLPILVVVRHAENIKRLLEGSEEKVLQNKNCK